MFESEEGIPSRGLVHPRTRVGGGARWIQVPAKAGTQETMGGAGRSEATVVPREGIPSSGLIWTRYTYHLDQVHFYPLDQVQQV